MAVLYFAAWICLYTRVVKVAAGPEFCQFCRNNGHVCNNCFPVRLQESSGTDVSELYMNIRRQELEKAAQEKLERNRAIPGMIGTQGGSVNSPFHGQGGGATASGFM